MLWYLWSQNRQEVPEGIYSHETALSLHELSDIMPSKLHTTVPRDFRRNGMIPEILILHRAHVDRSDVQEIHGVARDPSDANDCRSAAEQASGPESTEAGGERSHSAGPYRKQRNRSHAAP